MFLKIKILLNLFVFPPSQADKALNHGTFESNEALVDMLLRANVFEHVDDNDTETKNKIATASFRTRSPVLVDYPVPTISSVCCFLQDRPNLDKATIYRRYAQQISEGNRLDVAGIFDKYDLPNFLDWSRFVGVMPRIYDREDKVSYRDPPGEDGTWNVGVGDMDTNPSLFEVRLL